MNNLKKLLNSKATLNNLCSPEIVKLSQQLDLLVLKEQIKLAK